MRVWIADWGETGSEGLGVLERMGFPAKAWRVEVIVRRSVRESGLRSVLEKRVATEDGDGIKSIVLIFMFVLLLKS